MSVTNSHNSSWRLLAGAVLVLLGVLFLFEGFNLFAFLSGSLFGLIFIGAGLAFATVWYINRSEWWALIPGWVLAAIGIMTIMKSLPFLDNYIPAFVMWAVAGPFLVVFLSDRRQWWALIPGGIMGTIGLAFLFGAIFSGSLMNAVFLLGLAFAFYMFSRSAPGRRWARVPASVLAVFGVLAFVSNGTVFAILLLGIGVWLLLRATSEGSDTSTASDPVESVKQWIKVNVSENDGTTVAHDGEVIDVTPEPEPISIPVEGPSGELWGDRDVN